VLTEGDDQQDPIADSARAILDGHIVLSRLLADQGHYPAIDIEASISRAMTSLVDAPHFELTRRFRALYSRYQRNRDLVSVGAYAAGSDPLMDEALALHPRMEAFLQQNMKERARWADCAAALRALLTTRAAKCTASIHVEASAGGRGHPHRHGGCQPRHADAAPAAAGGQARRAPPVPRGIPGAPAARQAARASTGSPCGTSTISWIDWSTH
jgi:hypothetical protein